LPNNFNKGVKLSDILVPILALSWCNLSIIQPLKITQLKTIADGIHAIYLIYSNGKNIEITSNVTLIPIKCTIAKNFFVQTLYIYIYIYILIILYSEPNILLIY